jgi:hypothetical protein
MVIAMSALSLALFSATIASLRFACTRPDCIDTAKEQPPHPKPLAISKPAYLVMLRY